MFLQSIKKNSKEFEIIETYSNDLSFGVPITSERIEEIIIFTSVKLIEKRLLDEI